jgi:hypothetical protein
MNECVIVIMPCGSFFFLFLFLCFPLPDVPFGFEHDLISIYLLLTRHHRSPAISRSMYLFIIYGDSVCYKLELLIFFSLSFAK